jgi:hypothetical protein
MKLEDTEFNIEICENDDLINFWKEHGEHYKNCIKVKKGSKNGKKTKKVVNKNYLDPPIELGNEKYNNIILIKQLARKILNETKDGEKIEGKNAEFINVGSAVSSNKMLIFNVDQIEIIKDDASVLIQNAKLGLTKSKFSNNFDCLLSPVTLKGDYYV